MLKESLKPKSISLPVVIHVMTAQVLWFLRVPEYFATFSEETVPGFLRTDFGGGLHPSTQAPAPVTVQVADKGL